MKQKIEARITELEKENKELTNGTLILINNAIINDLKNLLRSC